MARLLRGGGGGGHTSKDIGSKGGSSNGSCGGEDCKTRSRNFTNRRANLFALASMAFLGIVSLLHGSKTRGVGTMSTTSSSSSFRTLTSPPNSPPPPSAGGAVMTDSTNATVMGIATNYGKDVFQEFVGSLRNVGYKGNIILAVSPDIDPNVEKYLISKNVMIKKLQYEECQHSFGKVNDAEHDSHQKEVRTCISPYPLLKHRWGRFPKLRDFLEECTTCTGPVLVCDVRDTYFQRDPFGDGQPQVEGLQVFMEHKSITTQHWLVEWPVRECKDVTFDHPMLCSGTTIGTRQAMLDYLQAMHNEMKLWMDDPKCHFDTNGDDQSIHNYLYWTGKLPFAQAIPNRQGLVHTVGALGSILHEVNEKFGNDLREKGITDEYFIQEHSPLREIHPDNVHNKDDPNHKQWMRLEYDIIDEEGFILDYDGTRSSIIHQYDRYGEPFRLWFNYWSGLVDKDD